MIIDTDLAVVPDTPDTNISTVEVDDDETYVYFRLNVTGSVNTAHIYGIFLDYDQDEAPDHSVFLEDDEFLWDMSTLLIKSSFSGSSIEWVVPKSIETDSIFTLQAVTANHLTFSYDSAPADGCWSPVGAAEPGWSSLYVWQVGGVGIVEPYLTGVYSDYGLDTNGDGKFEYLVIDIEINATVAGNYYVAVYDLTNSTHTIPVLNTTDAGYLTEGLYNITVLLSGATIFSSRISGPCTLVQVLLRCYPYSDAEYQPYTTSFYDYRQFSAPPACFTDTYSDAGVDLDGDGLFEYLRFTIGVNVTIGGNYTVSITGLLDSLGYTIYWWYSTTSELKPGVQNVRVHILGPQIFSSGANGPYTISHLYLEDSASNLLDWRDAPYTTVNAYSYTDFEEPARVLWSSDSMGNAKNTFVPTETVYVTARTRAPTTGENVTFYIVASQDVWNDGDPLTDVSDGAEQLTLDPGPGIQVVQVWEPPLTLGSYDIIEDTNNNGLYDWGFDGIEPVGEVGFVVEYTQITEYKAGFFTLGDIILFSYEDGLSVSIYDSSGTLLTTQSLDKGEHYFYHPGVGVYYAIGNKAFSVLIGDPITNNVVGYFAANASYYGVANEFYTYVSSDQDVITFAYKSGTTNVTVEEWDGSLWVALSTFSLTGPGDHYRVPATAWSDKWLHFTSNQPISVQSYSDRCFFVPDESGLWSGTHFYLFAGWREDTQLPGGDNLHIHSYKDSNIVTVKYIGGSTIWTGTLNDGEWVNIDRDTIGTNQYIEVISTDTVTVSDEPWAPFDYYGLLAVPDQSGTGVGTKFYTYARQSPPDGVGSIWVFAYNDGTNVEIKDMTAGGTILWTGTLNSNEYYQFVPPSGIGGHLFGIFSDNVVSVVEGTGGWGAEFVPLYSAAQVVLPKIIIDTPTDGEIIPTSDVTMTYHSPDPDIAYFEVRVDAGPWLNNSLATNFTFTGLSDGPHTLEVRAINTAGIVGIPDTVTITITVEYAPPVASFTYSPLTPYTEETVTFNASESYDPDGYIVSYFWDFGDGTDATSVTVDHTYADDGTYTVTLNVTDNDNLSSITSADVTVLNTPPVAIFTESAETVYTNEVITFNATDSYDPDGTIVAYFWDFGDGTNTTGVVVDHAYTDNGTYTVTLTVTDDDGATKSATSTKYVVDATKPVADAGLEQTVVEDTVVSFDAGGSSDNVGIVSYEWDFGDETTGTGITITHIYTEPGTYIVTLTVKDAAGKSDTDSIIITVQGDTDGDGTPDIKDTDDDNDGINDDEDAFPLDPTETVDTDGDEIGNNADTDDDNDGVLDVNDAFPLDPTESVDTDGDGIGNNTDTDDDNDGIPDVWETDNGLDPLDAQDASRDPDNDGLTSLQEYLENKDPNVYDAEAIREPRSIYIVAEVAVAGAVVTAVTAALASLGGLGQSFNSAVSKLPIPDKLKDFLQLYGEAIFETVDKVKLKALEKAPFITKGELAALGISALIITIVFGYIEANGLPHFLKPSVLAAVIPSTLLSVCMVRIAGELSEAFCARTCNVYRQYRLWVYGLGAFLSTGLLFLFPFASPGITRYQSGEISDKTKGLIVLSKMLVLLTMTIPFAGLFMLGFKIIGDAGLLLTLMTVCYSLVPLKPLVGKAVFDYRKEVSLIALVSAGILFYSCSVNLLPHVTYLAVGVVSVFLAAITLNQLRKAHPK